MKGKSSAVMPIQDLTQPTPGWLPILVLIKYIPCMLSKIFWGPGGTGTPVVVVFYLGGEFS
jgi:hypothetical protein